MNKAMLGPKTFLVPEAMWYVVCMYVQYTYGIYIYMYTFDIHTYIRRRLENNHRILQEEEKNVSRARRY